MGREKVNQGNNTVPGRTNWRKKICRSADVGHDTTEMRTVHYGNVYTHIVGRCTLASNHNLSLLVVRVSDHNYEV